MKLFPDRPGAKAAGISTTGTGNAKWWIHLRTPKDHRHSLGPNRGLRLLPTDPTGEP